MDEELLERLRAAETPDDVQVIVNEYDIEMSDEDAAKLFSELEEIRISATDGELSDEELEAVAGGFSFSSAWSKAKSVAKSAWDSYGDQIKDAAKGLIDKV